MLHILSTPIKNSLETPHVSFQKDTKENSSSSETHTENVKIIHDSIFSQLNLATSWLLKAQNFSFHVGFSFMKICVTVEKEFIVKLGEIFGRKSIELSVFHLPSKLRSILFYFRITEPCV